MHGQPKPESFGEFEFSQRLMNKLVHCLSFARCVSRGTLSFRSILDDVWGDVVVEAVTRYRDGRILNSNQLDQVLLFYTYYKTIDALRARARSRFEAQPTDWAIEQHVDPESTPAVDWEDSILDLQSRLRKAFAAISLTPRENHLAHAILENPLLLSPPLSESKRPSPDYQGLADLILKRFKEEVSAEAVKQSWKRLKGKLLEFGDIM